MSDNIDEKINNLVLWNSSNLEFVLEPDIYAYLEKVRSFIVSCIQFSRKTINNEDSPNQPFLWAQLWKNHLLDLITDAFSSFCCGNFNSAVAMTRTLIECHVYYQILSEHNELTHDWFICSLYNDLKKDQNLAKKLVRTYCNTLQLPFDEFWNKYHNNNQANAWASSLCPKTKRPSFRDLCGLLQDPLLYDDFQHCCNLVHGQDVFGKTGPFVFYESILFRFQIMVIYIFKNIRSLGINADLNHQMQNLEDELQQLIDSYITRPSPN